MAKYIVTTTADHCDSDEALSLRAAITSANLSGSVSVVEFDRSLTNTTIVLISGELSISTHLTICGLGADQLTISRHADASNFSLFRINPEPQSAGIVVQIEGITMAGGSGTEWRQSDPESRPLVDTEATAVPPQPNSCGGGIYNDGGTLVMRNSRLINNLASYGGGLYNHRGTVIISQSTVSANSARFQGGGIYNNGTLVVEESVFVGNSAQRLGGGIFNSKGEVSIRTSAFSSNAAEYGGGLYLFNGKVAIDRSSLHNNIANRGGSIYNHQSTVDIDDSTIIDGRSANAQ